MRDNLASVILGGSVADGLFRDAEKEVLSLIASNVFAAFQQTEGYQVCARILRVTGARAARRKANAGKYTTTG